MADVLSEFTFPRTGLTVRNRTVLAALTNKQSHEDGVLSQEEHHWLTMRGKGGFGIVTTAAANVTELGRGWEGELGVWSDHHLPGLSHLASKLSEHGAVSLAQLFHGGMRSPIKLTGVQPVSASENTEPSMKGIVTKELTHDEIESIITAFGNAAARCERPGLARERPPAHARAGPRRSLCGRCAIGSPRPSDAGRRAWRGASPR